jgi:VWFA-related protein
MKRVLVAVAVALLSLGVVAQVRETVNVNVVEVPVTVVDSNGNPVRGLTIANFELLDNGTKRPITSFDKIDFSETETLKATSPLNPAATRNFMLLFDLSNSGPNAIARAQDAARRFVADGVKPRDNVAVGTIEAQRGFRLLTAFTTDRRLVEQAIADPVQFRGTDPLQIGGVVSDIQLQDPNAAASGREGKSAADADMIERQNRIQQQNTQYARALAEKQIEALGNLAKTLRAVPGRKQVVMLSEGFDPKYIQGRDARSMEEQQKETAEIMAGRSYNVDMDARFGSSSSLSMLDRMAQTFRGSDVVLHAMDIQGVRVQNDVVSGARINSNEGLFLVANPTGGEVFKNANEIKTNFQRLLHQQEVVYVLGFQAPSQKAGSFHNLKVRLVNVPGGKVSHRAGYYEAGGETAQERALSSAEIIVNDIPQTDVRMTTLAAAFPEAGGDAQVPVIIDASGADLIGDFRGNALPVEFFMYAFDADGVVRDRLYQKITLDLKKVGDRLRQYGLKYYGTLSLPPGSYAVKSLVRAGDRDRRGFTRSDIVVAQPKTFAVTTPVPIEDNARAVLVRDEHAPGRDHPAVLDPFVGGTRPSSSGVSPFQLNGQSFIPSTTVHKGAGPQKIAVYVYGATADQLTWETNPKTKYLGHAKGGEATALVLELDPKDANVAAVDITVRKKGAPEATKISVPIAQ